jgi:spectinomycin phosphotransferase
VKSLPEAFEAAALIGVLADEWGFDVETADYANVGAGSYHWVVTDRMGTRGFVTVDDLDRKPWLGDTRSSTFDALKRSFDTAVALRDGGLGFVLAPILTSAAETVRRIGPRHSVALFPFKDGQTGSWGHDTAEERAAVLEMLAELHAATPAVASLANRTELGVPGRRDLDSALEDVNGTWPGGPFSELARRALAAHRPNVAAMLAAADRLSLEVVTRGTKWVVTHGEPHAGNVMRTDEGHMLIDWDTVALGPPERDLWMVVIDAASEQATVYTEATGHQLDETVMAFFRLTWDLSDLASYLNVVRSPHRHDEDTELAYERVKVCLELVDRWTSLLG